MYLEYLMQVEKDLDRRNATVLEKLLHALETLHTSLEEARPILQSSSLSRKPSLSDVLSLAVRITSSLSAPMNYDEEYANTVQFAPAPTEEMIRASKLAQWDM